MLASWAVLPCPGLVLVPPDVAPVTGWFNFRQYMINNLIPKTSSPQPPDELWVGADHLDSWKEIASYLRREIRTVQLWEKREGLPIHRHFHKQAGSVFALRSELERWKRKVSRKSGSREIEPVEAPKGAEAGVTIRVLPLKNLIGNAERRSICDGIVARTIAALEQLNPAQLHIVGPETPAKPQPAKIPTENSKREAVDYFLQWSIQDEGDGLRVDAALMVAGAEVVAWNHAYECQPNEFSEMPTYIADQIARCLWLKVFSSPTPGPAAVRREKTGARASYLRGRYFWNLRNEEGLRKAILCFESAIQEEPLFALPYSGLADSLTLLSFYEIVSPAEAMPSARRAALKAIELDPNLAEGHASLADVLLHFDRDWQAADREYRRSIECNPGYALGYHWYANLLTARGQHEAAHIAIMNALEIDPVSIITLVWAGVTSHLAHQFDDAIKHYQSALELNPYFSWAHMYMALALEQTGNCKGALKEFETTIQLAGGSNCVKAMKAHAHALAGDKSSAREILSEIKRGRSRKSMPSYDIAATHAALGECDQAMLWLNRACDERNMKLFTLTHDPRFDPLRHGSAFKQIVGQMGLQQARPAREPVRQ
jgi:tetratricopeptide (TPR) repeat protein